MVYPNETLFASNAFDPMVQREVTVIAGIDEAGRGPLAGLALGFPRRVVQGSPLVACGFPARG